jgi:hypothetical protein
MEEVVLFPARVGQLVDVGDKAHKSFFIFYILLSSEM